MTVRFDAIAADVQALLASGDRVLNHECEWAVSALITHLVAARSSARSYGFADGFESHELHHCGTGRIELKGLMHWTDGGRGWIDPIVAKLWLDPSSPFGFGYQIYYATTEMPTVAGDDITHRRLRKEFQSTSIEALVGRNDWALDFRSENPKPPPN